MELRGNVVKIGIIGAGAIGRGYLPWVFANENVEYFFVDTDKNLVDRLKSRGQFETYKVIENKLQHLTVKVNNIFEPSEEASKALESCDFIFVNVGPRACVAACSVIKNINSIIIFCENDPLVCDWVRQSLGLKNLYFAIPDVITSNTAPDSILLEDPNAVITEDGVLFIDEKVPNLRGDFTRCSKAELAKQWTAKLYIHNTPHCIAAYLGALIGVKYVHEAMQDKRVHEIVTGAMQEMLNALKLKWDISHDFLDWYAKKEISRFCNTLLNDPIARVAREPIRKLELDGRLIGAAQICLSSGFIPHNIILGIYAAMTFESQDDADRHVKFMMESLRPVTFLTYVLGLRRGEALEKTLSNHFDLSIRKLRELSGISRGANNEVAY